MGERTPDDGTRVWVTHEEPRPDAEEVVELLRRLPSLGGADPAVRAAFLARKDELISRIRAAESVPPPEP